MGPILWILHFLLDVLQACVLQDLPAVARYVVLSVAAVAVLALAFYALAPPTILQYCEQAQDEARSLLAHSAVSPSSGPGASDAGDTQDGPLSIMTSRLNALNEERSTVQHAVWDLSDSPISRVLLSRPWFLKALKLLYSYHVLVQDIKICVHRNSVSHCSSSDAAPGETNEAFDVVVSQEEGWDTDMGEDQHRRS